MSPTVVFDKSTLQSLKPDEVCWFGRFFVPVVTPIFFVETLADLNVEAKRGQTPEGIVSSLAYKTPDESTVATAHHNGLCIENLLGRAVSMDGRPCLSGGVPTDSGKGLLIKSQPEVEALARWQGRKFLEIERQHANDWRSTLASLDLAKIYKDFKGSTPDAARPRSLQEAKQMSRALLNRSDRSFNNLRAACLLFDVPKHLLPHVVENWKSCGQPNLSTYAPYAAFVLHVDMFFHLALWGDLISPDRPSNKADMAYLYYLPFCNIFVSHDKLHAATVPLFLRPDQRFVSGVDFKADLAKLDAHYSLLPEETRAQGTMRFAPRPPLEGEFLTSQLWDMFCPGWRARQDVNTEDMSPEQHEKILKMIKEKMKAAPEGSVVNSVPVDELDSLMLGRKMAPSMGKWRILPPGIEDKKPFSEDEWP